ncbi:hypothetical protein SAMN05444156_2176 [Verrucomicrobium sp. GAS474]|uniref:hypothetical protein n=1 Tax=Verrucomicrobium sp. GAS474 TaxID=1882831 RepID=UPI00087CECEA|nr:hypothetical protein [Verrucomicrobium sp. GAS474]SDU13652.1 hypothetical protein SAMN05444156_2176 [Verrucomicrobium sp. GAS474]
MKTKLPVGTKAIEIQHISLAKGGWEWARTRGEIRVAAIDPERYHRKTNHKGYLGTFSRSSDVTFDYPAGKWGYGRAEKKALEIAKSLAMKFDLPLFKDGKPLDLANA